jgi:type IV secretory pathway TrbD component
MRDLVDRRWIYLKAALFVLGGVMAAVMILLDSPSIRTAALLGISIWFFARAYYFAFYVMQRYVDPEFRFSGMGSMVAYFWRRRRAR